NTEYIVTVESTVSVWGTVMFFLAVEVKTSFMLVIMCLIVEEYPLRHIPVTD
ncbi:9984_t:CDS:1, partial [Funneliformis mosseae]